MEPYLRATTDIFFKYLFGSEENKDLLISFINGVQADLNLPQIISVEIKNPFNQQEYVVDKLSVVDIKATDERNRHFNIEMQATGDEIFKNRSLYYWAKLYTSQIKSGKQWEKLQPAYCINVLNYILFPEHANVHSCFTLKEYRENYRLPCKKVSSHRFCVVKILEILMY